MSIKDWPERERPREKLIHQGAGALSDAEVVAVLLRVGTAEVDAVRLAQRLISEHGGLRALLEASLTSVSTSRGCGPATFATLHAALELGHRYLYSTLERDGPLESPDAAGNYLVSRMKGYRREVFACLYLDTRHRVIASSFWAQSTAQPSILAKQFSRAWSLTPPRSSLPTIIHPASPNRVRQTAR